MPNKKTEVEEMASAIYSSFRSESMSRALASMLHGEGYRKETYVVDDIFNNIRDMIIAGIKVEGIRSDSCDNYSTQVIHKYAEELCQTLLSDLQKIERKYRK